MGVMSLVPDITAGTGTESDETSVGGGSVGWRSRKEHRRGSFPSMGLFSGCPAIWELADPRSTRRQVGCTVEILVRTATLATFRDGGLQATWVSRRTKPGSGA